jgi:hypothetical protein
MHLTYDSSKLVLLISLFEEFEMVTAVVMKISVSKNITPCRPFKVSLAFEGLHGGTSATTRDISEDRALVCLNSLQTLSTVEEISSRMVW